MKHTLNKPAASIDEYKRILSSSKDEIDRLTFKYHKGVDDDLKQNIFLDLWVNADRYDCVHCISTVVMRQGKLTLLEQIRKQKIRNKACYVTPDVPDVDSGEVNYDWLEEFINRESPEFQSMLRCKFWEDKTYLEISEQFKIPLQTIWTKFQRFFEKTKERIK